MDVVIVKLTEDRGASERVKRVAVVVGFEGSSLWWRGGATFVAYPGASILGGALIEDGSKTTAFGEHRLYLGFQFLKS